MENSNEENNQEISNENKKEEESSKCNFDGLRSVFGGMFALIAFGILTSIQNLGTYLMSWLKRCCNQNVETRHTYLLTPCALLPCYMFGFLGGIIDNKVGPKKTLLTSMSSIFIGFCILFTKNIYTTYVGLFFMGMGVAIGQAIPAKNAVKYYKQKEGIISNVMQFTLFSGISIFNLVGEAYINPNSLDAEKEDGLYKKEIAEKYPSLLLIQAFIQISLIILSMLIIVPYDDKIKKPNEEKESFNILPQSGRESEIKENSEKNIEKEEENILTDNLITDRHDDLKELKQAITSWKLRRLFLINLCNQFIFTLGVSTFRPFADRIGIESKYMQLFAILIGFISGAVLPLYGYLVDKISFKFLIISFSIGGILFGFGFYFCRHFAILYISLCSILYLLAGLSDSTAPHIMKVYGIRHCIEIFGIIGMACGIDYIISTGLIFILEFMNKDNPDRKDLGIQIGYFVGGGFAVIGLILAPFEDDEPFEYK